MGPWRRMRPLRSAALAGLLLAAPALLMAAQVDPFEKPAPWVVITTDGHRVDALARPERRGGRAFIRLAPHGQLTALPEASIDWEASERYNAPRPAPAPAAPVVEDVPAVPLAASEPGEPVELTIIGAKMRAAPAAPQAGEGGEGGESGEGGEGGAEAAKPTASDAAAGTAPTDKARIATDLAEIRRQIASSQSAYDQANQQVPVLEARLAELQQKAALEPRSSPDEKYESPVDRALKDVQAQLDAAREQVSGLDRRLNDLRTREMELASGVE